MNSCAPSGSQRAGSLPESVRTAAARPALVLACFVAAAIASCSLLLFPDVSGIVCFPSGENQVVAEGELPWLRFDFAPDRDSVEEIFTVSDFAGRVGGAYRWEGNTVCFAAEPPLIRGRRYVLSFSGRFQDERGVAYDIQRLVPFFYASDRESALYVVQTQPVSGQTIEQDRELRVEFSRPVDPLSAPLGLSLSPATEHELRWEEDGRLLWIRPVESWGNLTVYTLRLSEGLRDTAGAPLARGAELVFLVQEDTAAPTVVSILPAFNDLPGGFPETGLTLEDGPGCRDAIRISFSEAMDRDSTRGGFSITPAVAGQVHWPDESTLVFAPQEGFRAGVAYTVLLSERVTDRAGNALAGYLPVSFTPASNLILVTTTVLDDGSVFAPGGYSSVEAAAIAISLAGECNLRIEFEGGSFGRPGEKQRALEAITLRCLFPPSGVSAPELIGVSWNGDSRLSLTYAGLELSGPERTVYYLLRIRGGPGGLGTDEGHHLEADLEQLLRFEEALP